MIFTHEQEFHKAEKRLEQIIAMARQAAAQGERIDRVERDLMSELLEIGRSLLMGFVALQGDGDVGPTTTDGQGESCQRLPEPHTRRYVSIFGELQIRRFVYGSREGQRIQATPLDARLALPAGDFSYVLEGWAQRLCVGESFQEAGQTLASLLGLKLGVRTLEQMNQTLAEFAEPFRAAQPPPPAKEEGPILVFTADGKGVPMRRPLEERIRGHHRRTKGAKANKKQLSYVGAVYSIDRFVRSADDVLDDWQRRERSVVRPVPRHKRVWTEMTEIVEGEEINGRERLFGKLADEVWLRNHGGRKEMVCLLDGERALWDMYRVHFPEAVGILDLFHVLEKLWLAAHCFHAEGSQAAEDFVSERLRGMLEGRVGAVIGGLRQRLTKHRLTAAKRKTLTAVIGYLDRNQDHLHYDAYLAAGYPIGSGVAEGACRHVVKDRMERTGMRWTLNGAQAMLDLRATYINGDWDAFIEFRIRSEQADLHTQTAA